MELADEITIHAPLDKVYEGLNNIAILKACIPGCEALNWTNENELEAKVTLKIGPVKAKFKGRVTLDTANAPKGFSLTGEGVVRYNPDSARLQFCNQLFCRFVKLNAGFNPCLFGESFHKIFWHILTPDKNTEFICCKRCCGQGDCH